MRVPLLVHKCDGLQQLPREGLDQPHGVSVVVVLLDELVERQA